MKKEENKKGSLEASWKVFFPQIPVHALSARNNKAKQARAFIRTTFPLYARIELANKTHSQSSRETTHGLKRRLFVLGMRNETFARSYMLDYFTLTKESNIWPRLNR